MVHGAPARKKSQSDVLNSNNGNVNGTENVQPTPPDGGWGWMVVFGSFMIHIISKYKSNNSKQILLIIYWCLQLLFLHGMKLME